MSTVTVSYQLKSIKLKVTPGTPVNELVEKAASHFILDATRFGLYHNNKELSSSLPFRLLNLPAGAKLSLQLTKSKKSAEITIKIQFINSPFEKSSVVKKINNQSSLKDLIGLIEEDVGSPIWKGKKELQFQSMSRVVNQVNFPQTTLSQLGAENNASIRLLFENPTKVDTDSKESERTSTPKPKSEPKKEPSPSNVPAKINLNKEEKPKTFEPEERKPSVASSKTTSTTQSIETQDEVLEDAYPSEPEVAAPIEHKEIQTPAAKNESPKPIEKHLYVYKPSETPIETHEPDQEEYDLTVSHARQYQNMLSQQAHESNKSKRLRQEANKKKIINIEIRVKFPDDSSLQVNFRPNETNRDLYNVVADTLVDQSEFELTIPYPLSTIANNSTKLTEKFESRNLVLFKSKKPSGPYLKPDYLRNAKDLKEAEDIKQELARKNGLGDVEEVTDTTKIKNGMLPKKGSSGSKSSDDGKGKLPKWLKLGKK